MEAEETVSSPSSHFLRLRPETLGCQCSFVCLFELKAAGGEEDVKEDKVWLHIWPPPPSSLTSIPPLHYCILWLHQIKPLYYPSHTETGKLPSEPTAELFAAGGGVEGGTVCCYKSNLGSLPVDQRREEDWAVVSVARGRMRHAGEFSHYCQELLKFANKNTVFSDRCHTSTPVGTSPAQTTQPRPNLSALGPSLTHTHVYRPPAKMGSGFLAVVVVQRFMGVVVL